MGPNIEKLCAFFSYSMEEIESINLCLSEATKMPPPKKMEKVQSSLISFGVDRTKGLPASRRIEVIRFLACACLQNTFARDFRQEIADEKAKIESIFKKLESLKDDLEGSTYNGSDYKTSLKIMTLLNLEGSIRITYHSMSRSASS